MIDFETTMAIIAALVFGARALLLVIAPLTPSSVDDKIVAVLEKIALKLK